MVKPWSAEGCNEGSRDCIIVSSFWKTSYATEGSGCMHVWKRPSLVNVKDGNDMVWINFMTSSIPNFPGLVQTSYSQQPSYFIDSDERLVVCSCDETGKAWIYVMGGNKLISKVHLDSVVDPWPWHCTYFLSLVPVPRGQRDVAELQV